MTRAYPPPGDGGAAFATVTEYALAILADLPAPAWQSIHELTAANLAGNLSFDAWRAATGAILTHAAQGLEAEGAGATPRKTRACRDLDGGRKPGQAISKAQARYTVFDSETM